MTAEELARREQARRFRDAVRLLVDAPYCLTPEFLASLSEESVVGLAALIRGEYAP